MAKQVTPEAFFDSLSLADKLDNFLDGFRLPEIHLFSYFSSFLYCYAGNSIATWQHRYIAVDGYPFSDSINEAISRHIQNGLFENDREYYTITSRGTKEFDKFKSLPTFENREKILTAACTTSILIPYSQTLRGLLSEPDLKKAQELSNNQWIDATNFYPQFKKISDAIGINSDDLMIPAVTWVNYLLAETTKTETDGTGR